MKTSYFKAYLTHRLRGGISIARSSPRWVSGYKLYRKLNPGPWFKSCATTDEYIDRYCDEILDPLDAEQTYNELISLVSPLEPILLCWESPDQFCHRDVVRAWFKESLGVDVFELALDFSKLVPCDRSPR